MGQRRQQYFEVDVSKLYRALRKHGIKNLSELSEKAGHDRGWASKTLKRGGLNEPAILWLKYIGIEYDDIKPEPTENESHEVKPMTVRDLTKEDLKEMIRSAMLAALNAEGV